MDELYQSPADNLIISSSIDILKEAYPTGLTIKELHEALLAAHKKDIQPILKSSTILSTKLNAFYRKCQNLPATAAAPATATDSDDNLPPRFKVCPIVRQNATDNSKRLVYKYCKSLDDVPAEDLANPLPSIPIMSPKSPLSPTHSDDADVDDSLVSRLNERLSPPESSSPYHLRRVIKKTAHAFVPPSIKRRSSSSSSASAVPTKRPRTLSHGVTSSSSKPSPVALDYQELGGVNPYYDFPDMPVLPNPAPRSPEAAAEETQTLPKPDPAPEQLDWFNNVDEFAPPELLTMDDLDSMFD